MEILCETKAVATKSQTLTGSRNELRKLTHTTKKLQEVHQIVPISNGGK